MTELVSWAKESLRLHNIALLVVILAVGAVLLFLRPRSGRLWIVAVVVGYWFVSTPFGSSLLVMPLVREVHSIESRREAGSVGAIVVLGGGTRDLKVRSDELAYPYESTTLRVLEAARVFRLLDGEPIVVASGGVALGNQTSEAVVITEALVKLHVPRDHIVLEDKSLTTREEAVVVTSLLKSRGITRFILVTSPMHVSRAVAVFRAQHADVVPSAAALAPERPRRPLVFMPNDESLNLSDEAVYGYASVAYYWARGWFQPEALTATR